MFSKGGNKSFSKQDKTLKRVMPQPIFSNLDYKLKYYIFQRMWRLVF